MYREIRRLEGRNWWFVGMRRIAEALLGEAAARPARALDLGCGSGGNLELVSRHAGHVTAVDLSVDALRTLQGAASCCADARALPFRPGSFGLVNLFNVIEHVADDQGTLAEISRVLAPGGVLLLATSAFPALWSDHDEVNHHVRRYTRRELEAKLRSAGFRVEQLTFANTALLPPTFVVASARRVLKRAGLLRPYQTSLLEVPPLMNTALTWLLSAEAPLVRRGVCLPAGVSLLARVRKP